jgi:hypothetical protein
VLEQCELWPPHWITNHRRGTPRRGYVIAWRIVVLTIAFPMVLMICFASRR